MRALLILLACLGIASAASAADAVKGRVLKVLPFYLDLEGRTALSPSLYDRDAYQAHLRGHTNEVSALRYDVLWSASRGAEERIKITIELRGLGRDNVPKVQTLETNVVPGKYRRWTSLPLAGADFKNIGSVAAWRARLWNGDEMLSEQKSFLW